MPVPTRNSSLPLTVTSFTFSSMNTSFFVSPAMLTRTIFPANGLSVLFALGSAALAKMHDPTTSPATATRRHCLFIDLSSIERIEKGRTRPSL
jgi:hypothetical protein